MLLHWVEIVATHWDLSARPKVGFRFHVVQISSLALYLGLGAQFIALTINHQSVAEPLLQRAATSPLVLALPFLWILLGPALQKNRRVSQRRMSGSVRRGLLASILSTTVLIGVLVALQFALK